MMTSMKLSPPITLSEAGAGPLSFAEEPQPAPRPWYANLWRRPFFLLVIVPSLIAALYFYAIAAPQYVSEARFVVSARGSDGGAQSAMRGMAGAAFGGLGGMASSETNSVRDFLTSLDAVMEANTKLDLISLWQRPESDFLARLWNTEPELLARFYNRMVTVSLDPATNVTTLRVRSFRPEDSKSLAETLLSAHPKHWSIGFLSAAETKPCASPARRWSFPNSACSKAGRHWCAFVNRNGNWIAPGRFRLR